jgi:hypothetical protein
MGISDFRALAKPADFTVLALRIIFYPQYVKRQNALKISGLRGSEWPNCLKINYLIVYLSDMSSSSNLSLKMAQEGL